MMPDKFRYIVVEGPIGVGKTSLARRLSEHFQAGLMLEDADTNPFLSRFYQDMERYALQTQLFFLFQRASQVRDLKQLELFGHATVADFLLDKDPLFARLNLNDEEYRLYQQIYAHLQPQTPTPDLVIYLQAPVESLIERVRRRGVAYESPITEDYLARLAEGISFSSVLLDNEWGIRNEPRGLIGRVADLLRTIRLQQPHRPGLFVVGEVPRSAFLILPRLGIVRSQ